jgi:hypothetical protein
MCVCACNRKIVSPTSIYTTTLYFTALLHYTTLHYTAPHYDSLHYTILALTALKMRETCHGSKRNDHYALCSLQVCVCVCVFAHIFAHIHIRVCVCVCVLDRHQRRQRNRWHCGVEVPQVPTDGRHSQRGIENEHDLWPGGDPADHCGESDVGQVRACVCVCVCVCVCMCVCVCVMSSYLLLSVYACK